MKSRNQNAKQDTMWCSMLLAVGSDRLPMIAPAASSAGVLQGFTSPTA
jgi:hypothetical protein